MNWWAWLLLPLGAAGAALVLWAVAEAVVERLRGLR
jgi:hypothetical protein